MRLNNWLVYSFAKNGLIVLSFIIVAFAVVELVSVFFGYTIVAGFGSGFHFNWEQDPVAPDSLSRRLLFMLPGVIVFVVAAYCLLQVAFLLQNIHRGDAFRKQNFRKLSKIGVAILLTNLLLMVFGLLQLPVVTGARNDIDPALLKDQPAFSLVWVLVGCICLLLAHAFRTGARLQREADLHI
jgi:hypothetical protein